MKIMYIVDYWEPFPRTEYGGLFAVVASDDNECFELLKSRCYYRSGDDKDAKNLLVKNAINKAKKFALLDPTTPSEIVEEMLT
jgi:hypothetical protein